MEKIGWLTVCITIASACGGGLIVLAGVFAAWGQLKAQVKVQKEFLKEVRKKLDEQEKRDHELTAIIKTFEARCEQSGPLIATNIKEHDEIFERLKNLEILTASLPGELAEKIFEKTELWRQGFIKDIEVLFNKNI